MKFNTMRCRECHAEMALRALDPMTGEEAGVRMMIEGMPVMFCKQGHKRFVAPEFAVKLMEALLGDGKLVPGEPAPQKGWLRKHWVCPGCGKDLDENAPDHVEVKRVLELKGVDAFGVRVEVPTFRCADCGKESVLPDAALGDALMKASAQAFRLAEVSPT